MARSTPAEASPLRRFLTRRVLLTPLLPRPRLPRRLVQLCVGLYLFGLGLAAQVASGLGVAPWDVLHQGLHLRTGWSIGTWVIITGVAVLVLWIPLRQRAGLGTLANAVIIGVSIDVSLLWLPEPDALVWQLPMVVSGTVAVALGSGLYIGAGMGPGPRDGLMTGLAERGWSIRMARLFIEAVAVAAGFALGGTVGVGTLLFAVLVGPLTQLFLPPLRIDRAAAG